MGGGGRVGMGMAPDIQPRSEIKSFCANRHPRCWFIPAMHECPVCRSIQKLDDCKANGHWDWAIDNQELVAEAVAWTGKLKAENDAAERREL